MECTGPLIAASDGKGNRALLLRSHVPSFVLVVESVSWSACCVQRWRRGSLRSVQFTCSQEDGNCAWISEVGAAASAFHHRGMLLLPCRHHICPSLRGCMHRLRLPIAIHAGAAVEECKDAWVVAAGARAPVAGTRADAGGTRGRSPVRSKDGAFLLLLPTVGGVRRTVCASAAMVGLVNAPVTGR
jgi:hypothetical protein